jgi:hypothetical protein
LQLSAIETKGQANLNACEKKWQALTFKVPACHCIDSMP